MQKERLTAFSDGVIAIIITIMVLELKAPHGDDLAALSRCARFPELRAELRLHRDLLEQPPSPAAGDPAGQRRRAVGESAPAVLAVADPVRNGMDGREPLRQLPTAVYGVVAADAGASPITFCRAGHHQARRQ